MEFTVLEKMHFTTPEVKPKFARPRYVKDYEIDYNFSHIDTYSQARNIHSTEEAKESTADALDITPDDMVISDRVDVVFELI